MLNLVNNSNNHSLFRGVTDTFHKCLDHVLSALRQRPLVNHLGGDIITGLRSGALLICGSGTGAGIGCGKTSLAHAVCHQLQQWPVCAHVTLVDCIPFRGNSLHAVRGTFTNVTTIYSLKYSKDFFL